MMEYQNLIEIKRWCVLDLETRYIRRYTCGALLKKVDNISDNLFTDRYFVVGGEIFRMDIETW